MVLVDLANNMSVKLADVSYTYAPRRWIALTFLIYPTVGKAFADSAHLMRRFSMQWHEDNGLEQQAVVDAFVGKTVETIVAAVLAQWAEFCAARPFDIQFLQLFEYVNLVGIAT